MRFGEAAARRWRHYKPDAKPLGRLHVNTSYNQTLKREGLPKGKRFRDVPVHPLLAAILADWKLHGWAEAMGAHGTTEDDLIVPSCETEGKAGGHFGKFVDPQMLLRRFHTDHNTVGVPWRRQHDARRTFISLCLSDGGRKEIVRSA